MKTKIIYSLILALSMFFVVGCGSDDKADPIVDNTGPYTFFNATTPLKITKPLEINGTIEENSHEISVQLLKFGLVAPGESVQMLPFDLNYGSVVNTVVDTDENGRAIFEFKAPEGKDYDAIIGQDIIVQTIYLDNEEVLVGDEDKEVDIVLTQDFLLQFR